MNPTRGASSWLVWAALWTVYIVWGSTYLAIRVAVETMPPMLAAGARFLVAGAVALLFLALRRGAASLRVTRRELLGTALVGTALLFGGNGLVMVAEQTVPSGVASLIIASVPLWVVLMRKVAGDSVPGPTLAGVAGGFAGVGLLLLPGGENGAEGMLGPLLLVVASLSWAAGSFMSRSLTLPGDIFVSTSLQMLCGGIVLTLAGVARGEAASVDLGSFSTASALALVYLIVFGSWLAFTAYVWLLQHAPISKVATYAYVNPVIAVLLGWAILDEVLTPVVLAGAAIVTASVAFTIRSESSVVRRAAPPAAAASVGGSAAARVSS